MDKTNLIGAISANSIFLLTILIFVARLAGRPEWGTIIGIPLLLIAIPLVYLLVMGPHYDRSVLFYIQISLMLLFLVCEFLLDYVLKIDFRKEQWMVISYVTLFFAATGGMIGVAGLAGRFWSISSVILFLIMTALAFYQRFKTGM